MTSPESTQLDQAEAEPRYAELARRLIAERADLFRVAPPRAQPRLVQAPPVGAAVALTGRRRRRGQLALPLRPQLLDGGDRVST